MIDKDADEDGSATAAVFRFAGRILASYKHFGLKKKGKEEEEKKKRRVDPKLVTNGCTLPPQAAVTHTRLSMPPHQLRQFTDHRILRDVAIEKAAATLEGDTPDTQHSLVLAMYALRSR